jgi:hypothetical protein
MRFAPLPPAPITIHDSRVPFPIRIHPWSKNLCAFASLRLCVKALCQMKYSCPSLGDAVLLASAAVASRNFDTFLTSATFFLIIHPNTAVAKCHRD